ncbi:MAG: hypothetical protein L3K07_03270 [Thermoplasmata archaeon]|nr:hypothetical protein [Thermoplasmata archaeon]
MEATAQLPFRILLPMTTGYFVGGMTLIVLFNNIRAAAAFFLVGGTLISLARYAWWKKHNSENRPKIGQE